MNIAITMAGEGRRFREVGYKVPKYRIEAKGRSLFAWSLDSLRAFFGPGHRFLFIARRAEDPEAYIEEECRALGIRRHGVRLLDRPTDGQATTAMLAEGDFPGGEPFAVFNIDTHVQPGLMAPGDVRGDGWIPCFPAEGDRWSFVRTDATGRAVEVREKVRVSPHASVGFYAFRDFDLFAEAYRAERAPQAGERYVAPLYNHLIRAGMDVRMHALPLSGVHVLGTPQDLEAFLHDA